MWQTALNMVITASVAALSSVLVVVIKAFGDASVEFIKEKIKALQTKVGTDKWNQNLAFAESAWKIVDEYFRITPTVQKTIESTGKMFADEMKKFVPSLTDAEIEQLRQAIAGEVNKGKDVVVAPTVSPASIESK